MAVITSPNLDHASLLLFEKNFERLASNKDTKLLNCPAIKHMDIKGISNVSRIEGNDLVDVTASGRNPEKQYLTIRNDNRKSVAKRFTGTYLVDSYDRAVKLITDPTSDLFLNLKEAKNRLTDKCIIDSAVGSVTVGGPDEAGTTLTASQDGVKTLAGTSLFDYTLISKAITTFKNQYIETEGVTLAISATEEQSLRNDDKYMNALYSNQNTVDRGTITNASGFNVVTFAGNVQGGTTVDLPILPESTSNVRSNVLMAPKSIGFAVEIGRLDCERSATHVNSWEVTIDMWVKAVRLQGSKVIILTSTM